jgi:hypothetical protein
MPHVYARHVRRAREPNGESRMGRTRKTLEDRLNSPAVETSASADFSITCRWVTAVWVSLNLTLVRWGDVLIGLGRTCVIARMWR